MEYEKLLTHFKVCKQKGDTAQANCPSHDDKHASLSIALSDNRILIYCHAGCTIDEVLRSANLTLADLFIGTRQAPAAIYQYRKADGSLSHEKLKYQNKAGKTFKQRQLLDGKIVDNIDGVSRIPYNLPAVMQAVKAQQPILYVEGEKDANTGKILGFTATTMGGAGDWKDEYKRYFFKTRVVQIPDKDLAGLKLASSITDTLVGVAKSLKVVILPEGKDLTEWVTEGNSRKELDLLIDLAPELVVRKEGVFDWRDYAISHPDLMAREYQPLEFLVKDLFTTPGLGVLGAFKKRMKTWMALQLSQAVASGAPFLNMPTKQGSVVHMALEDGERRIRQRLEMQHSNGSLPITYISRFEPLNTPAGITAFRGMIQEKKPALIVIDTLASAKSKKMDENEAGATADLFNLLHTIALENKLFLLIVAHHGKPTARARDAGFDIRGSSAIPGATDVNVGLYKNDDDTFDLWAEGRDIGELELSLKFDYEQTWAFQCRGDARELRKTDSEDRIIEALGELGNEATIYELADAVGVHRVTLIPQLKRMKEGGAISTSKSTRGNKTTILYKRENITYNTYTTTLPTHPTIPTVVNVGDYIYYPDYPKKPCQECGSEEWQVDGEGRYVCPNKHMAKGGDNE